MHTVAWGEGPTLIFLHGTAPPESLYGLAERLADRFHTVVVSLPGYGESAQIDPRTPDDVVEALAELLDEFEDEQVSLVGHSGGAYFALALAARVPDKIERVALLAPAHHMTEELKAELPQFAAAARAGELSFEGVLPLWFSEGFAAAHPGVVNELDEPFARDIDALADDLDSYAHARDLRGDIRTLEQPVYVRSGTEDVRTTPETVREIEELLPAAQVEFVEEVGHMIQIEDAEQTADALRAFFGGK